MKMLFLGGTCGNNNWREEFTKQLVSRGVSPDVIFNPVVPDWNEEVQKKEEEMKASASHMLFYIANPKLEGVNISAYSLVEATMALYDRPETTVIVFDNSEVEGHVLKAMKQSFKVLSARFPKANIFDSLDDALNFFENVL